MTKDGDVMVKKMLATPVSTLDTMIGSLSAMKIFVKQFPDMGTKIDEQLRLLQDIRDFRANSQGEPDFDDFVEQMRLKYASNYQPEL